MTEKGTELMDCEKSIEMLSDFHDGDLNEGGRIEVSTHLAECRPCAGLYRDLDSIVLAARSLRAEPGISFPDEEALWQRMRLASGTIH